MTDVPNDVKQPEDHKESPGPYTWTAEDGRTATFMPFASIPTGVFRKARQMDELGSTFALLEAATDEAGLGVIDDLPIGELDKVFEAWTAASGVDAPES
jgi:hypothetical protein